MVTVATVVAVMAMVTVAAVVAMAMVPVAPPVLSSRLPALTRRDTLPREREGGKGRGKTREGPRRGADVPEGRNKGRV